MDRRPLPGVRIVDMREERRLGRLSIFSSPLADRIKDRLLAGADHPLPEPARFSPFVQCYDCGLSVSCPPLQRDDDLPRRQPVHAVPLLRP